MKYKFIIIFSTIILIYGLLIAKNETSDIYNEPFNNNLDDVITYNVVGAQEWGWDSYDDGCAKMSGYYSGTQYTNEDWLITPQLDFSSYNNITLNFREAINYEDGSIDENEKVIVSTDYSGSGDPNNANWTEINVTGRSSGNSWTFVDVDDVDLSPYIGEPIVYIGFKYSSSTSNAATWEIGEIIVSDNGGGGAFSIVGANATTSTSVTIIFNDSLDSTTAENVANYSINPLLDISEAEVQNGTEVVLTTAEQIPGTEYTITVNNVEDLAGNAIEPNSTVDFTGYSEGGQSYLFFSEYIEGSSNNKALEIFNGSDSTISLTNYQIAQSVNGNGWQYYHSFPDTASLNAGEVWVITTDEAEAELQAVADEILSYPSVVHFNGNDARALEKSIDGGKSWEIIDIIGDPDEDPGNGWEVAGVSEATYDHTIVRKSSVTSGNTNWNSSAGTTTENSEWIVYPEDTFEYLGYHGEDDTTPPSIVSASAISPTAVKITFNEQVDENSAQYIPNYSITNLTISNVVLQPEGKKVELTTSQQTEGMNYTITVNNVEDLAGNAIEPNSTVDFTGFEAGDYTPIADIQNNYNMYEGEEVTVCAVVTIGDSLLYPGKTKFYIQDSSGKGIQVYHGTPLPIMYKRGDKIEVTGIVDKYETDVELTEPEVTLLAESQNLPEAHILTDEEDETWNGTWSKAIGEIIDIWDAIDDYGFYQITLEIDGNEIPLMFWETTGADVSEYEIGDNVVCFGVITFYEGEIQLTCGYEEDISLSSGFDYFGIEPIDPQPYDSVKITFICPTEYTGNCDSANIYWNTMQHHPFNIISMNKVEGEYNKFATILSGKPAGTIVYFYAEVIDTTTGIHTNFPENAPYDIVSFQYELTKHEAKLRVPPRTFCPIMGENIQIQVHTLKDDKVILRLYNSEGKLVYTFFNKISLGAETIYWNGKDDTYQTLPPGLYICHLEATNTKTGDKKTATAPIVISIPLKD